MTNDLSIDGEKVVRAAEEMIAQHEDSALAEADKKVRTGKSEGFDYVVWKLIREVLGDTHQSDTTKEGYRKALNPHFPNEALI